MGIGVLMGIVTIALSVNKILLTKKHILNLNSELMVWFSEAVIR
jgi:hypothetical protein